MKFRPETLKDIYEFLDYMRVDKSISAFHNTLRELQNTSGG